jgi:hypothetical protein
MGVVTCTLACLPKSLKAKEQFRWVVMIMDGPTEPTHVAELLRPVMAEWLELATNGLTLTHGITRKGETLKFGPAVAVCDVPAAAKLSEGPGHGGYRCCNKCYFEGVLCGCKALPQDQGQVPTPIDNEVYRGNGPRAHVTSTGAPFSRKKRPGEHIAWVDVNMITPDMYRSEVQIPITMYCVNLIVDAVKFVQETVRSYQATVDGLLRSKVATDKTRSLTRKKYSVNGLSVMTMFPPSLFSVTRDHVEDAMHLLIEGCLRKLVGLTFDKNFATCVWSIRANDGALTEFNRRMRSVTFPPEFTR